MKNNGKIYKVQLPTADQEAAAQPASQAPPAPATLAPAPPRRALEQALAHFESTDYSVLMARALRDRVDG